MRNRFDVILNDISLAGMNADLYITDISYPVPEVEFSVANFAGKNGGLVTGTRKSETRVTVTFELHVYDPQMRQKACQEIASWAVNGGKLQTSDRPDQYLQCVCTRFPSIESAMKWTDQLKAEFTAYSVPYWQSVIPEKLILTGTNETGELYVPGNAEATADVTVSVSGTMTSLSITFGDTIIHLTGLSLHSGDTVDISHDENGILHIEGGGISLLGNRTASSDDDLSAPCGNVDVGVQSNVSVTAEFRVKGVWN